MYKHILFPVFLFLILKNSNLSAQCNTRLTVRDITIVCGQDAQLNILFDPTSPPRGMDWAWNFGDINSGNLNTISGTAQNLIPNGLNVRHRYNTAGSYIATLNLTPVPALGSACYLTVNGVDYLDIFDRDPTFDIWEIRINVTVLPSMSPPYINTDDGSSGVCQGASRILSIPPVAGSHYQWQMLTASPNSAWVNIGRNTNSYSTPTNLPLGPHIFRVIITEKNGCITISQLRTIVVMVCCQLNASISGNAKICQGSATTLQAFINPPSSSCAANYTYLWSTGETTQTINPTPPANTIYSVTITCPSTGCRGTASVLVNIMPASIIDLVSQTIKCNGISNIVSIDINVRGGTPPYRYIWSNGITTQDLVNITGTAAGYCVAVTDANGCKTVKCFSCLNPCGGNSNLINEPPKSRVSSDSEYTPNNNRLKESDAFKLEQNTPNPFSDKTRIAYELPENIGKVQIIITDLTGKQIKTIALQNCCGEIELSAHDFPSGTFVYSLVANGKVLKTNKMVIAKN